MDGYLRDNRFNMILYSRLGVVAEALACRLLELDGFKVVRFSMTVMNYIWEIAESKDVNRREVWNKHTLREGQENLFTDNVRKFVDELIEIKRADTGKNTLFGYGGEIDFIAEKNNELYLIEAKSSNAKLLPTQKKALKLARKYCLKGYVLKIDLDVKFSGAELLEVE